ncbi:hypothetical protein SDC9_91514 [bioreactor metagenome]|uniref:HK97 gp10 family phage protein n=1 Tax=bioreactor metagenome TaxID=1076179 RepID=A0A644ZVH1_9ZZZZ
MARFQSKGIDELIKLLDPNDIAGDEILDAMLVAGASVMKKYWIQGIRAAGHIDTGDMLNSVGFSAKPRKKDGVRSISIYPRGTDEKGVRNAQKAFVLNYGTSKIAGSHFVDAAERAAQSEIEKAMNDVYEEKLREKGLTK